MPEGLQLIIGTDKKNSFTVYKDINENKYHIFFGMSLFEVVDNDKSNPELKLLLARLYNSGVKVKTLIEHFGFSYPTYKHWGDALKSGDEERLYWALSGQGGGGKKLKPEVVAFIMHDFGHVYSRNKYSYSKEIRQDIKDVYQLELSSECIRPLLGKLKKAYLEKKGNLSEEKKKPLPEFSELTPPIPSACVPLSEQPACLCKEPSTILDSSSGITDNKACSANNRKVSINSNADTRFCFHLVSYQ